jgi:hypothetical protein
VCPHGQSPRSRISSSSWISRSRRPTRCATDEPETLDGLPAVQAVARCRAPRRGEKSPTLVAPDRVRRDLCRGGELRDGQTHVAKVRLGAHSKVNTRFARAGRVPSAQARDSDEGRESISATCQGFCLHFRRSMP